MRKRDIFVLTILLLFSIVVFVYTAFNSEVKGLSTYNYWLMLVLPLVIFVLTILNAKIIYKYSTSIEPYISALLGITLVLSFMSCIYPITPLYQNSIEPKKNIVSELNNLAKGLDLTASDLVNSGNYYQFDKDYLNQEVVHGDYTFNFYPGESLRKNIMLTQSGDDYKMLKGNSGSILIGATMPSDPRGPIWHTADHEFIFLETRPEHNLEQASQIFLNMKIGSEEKRCFISKIYINKQIPRENEFCVFPPFYEFYSESLDRGEETEDIKKVKITIEESPDSKSLTSHWGYSDAEIRIDSSGMGQPYSSFCFEGHHKAFPEDSIYVIKGEILKGKCSDTNNIME